MGGVEGESIFVVIIIDAFACFSIITITKTRPCNIQRFFTAVKMTILS